MVAVVINVLSSVCESAHFCQGRRQKLRKTLWGKPMQSSIACIGNAIVVSPRPWGSASGRRKWQSDCRISEGRVSQKRRESARRDWAEFQGDNDCEQNTSGPSRLPAPPQFWLVSVAGSNECASLAHPHLRPGHEWCKYSNYAWTWVRPHTRRTRILCAV